MRTYDCPYCRCHFSEADKSWDVAIASNQCPECREPFRKSAITTEQRQEKPSAQQPYPLGSVLIWVLFAFLLGLITARPTWKSATSIDRSVLGVFVGSTYAVITALIVGIYKYFHRNPSHFLGKPAWTQVTAEEAKRHPLYGAGGWLAVFAMSTLVGFLRDLGDVNVGALKAGISLGKLLAADTPDASFLRQLLTIEALGVVIVSWLLFSKNRNFRVVSTCILLGLWPATALAGSLNPFPELGELLLSRLIPWAVYSAVWVTYLQKSKRVRVTFEHAVRIAQDTVESVSNIFSDTKARDTLADVLFIDTAHKKSDQSLDDQKTAITREPLWDLQVNDSPKTRVQEIPSGVSKSMSSLQPTANPIASVSIPVKPSQDTTEAHEDRLYEQIARELEANTVDKGLWTKAYAQAGGDDKQTRVLYIKARFTRLLAMEDARRARG